MNYTCKHTRKPNNIITFSHRRFAPRSLHSLRSGFVTKTTRGRSFISKYKAFCGPKDGIGTIASKFAKLSVFWLGWNPPNSPPSRISYGTQAFLKLWNYITPYFNPSNLGNWTVGVGILLQYTSRLLTRRVGASLAVDELEGAEKEVRGG